MPAQKKIKTEPGVSPASSVAPIFERRLVYPAAFVAAFSTVAYGFLLAHYGTFMMGVTVHRYSLVISSLAASMGLGALATQRIKKSVIEYWLGLKIALSLGSATVVPALYVAFSRSRFSWAVLLLFVFATGGLLGAEVPLLARLHRQSGGDAGGPGRVLFFYYLGGFFGSLVFPSGLLPRLGFFGAAASVGFLNALLTLGLVFGLRKLLGARTTAWTALVSSVTALSAGSWFGAESLRIFLEQALFQISR